MKNVVILTLPCGARNRVVLHDDGTVALETWGDENVSYAMSWRPSGWIAPENLAETGKALRTAETYFSFRSGNWFFRRIAAAIKSKAYFQARDQEHGLRCEP